MRVIIARQSDLNRTLLLVLFRIAVCLLVVVCLSCWSFSKVIQQSSQTTSEDNNNEPRETDVFINWRLLEGKELESYKSLKKDIESTIAGDNAKQVTNAVKELLMRIEKLPKSVQESTREVLRHDISEHIQECHLINKNVINALLDTDKEIFQMVAIDSLEQSPDAWWFADPRSTYDRLISLLSSKKTESSVRQAIIMAFFTSDAFENIRSLAQDFARDETDRDLAWTAAFALCAALKDENFKAHEVIDYFASSTGILRQEAALALTRFYYSNMSDDLRGSVIRELISMATNTKLEPVLRGEAIEEVGRYITNRNVLITLLELLQPEWWFFGVKGSHHAEHSLTAVIDALYIDALYHGPTDVVLPKLLELQKIIGLIPEPELHEVEIRLNIVIKYYLEQLK